MTDTNQNQGPAVGDLVVCRDSEYQKTMRLPAEPGVIVAIRKDQGEVFFPSILGEAWIPNYHLSRIKNPERAGGLEAWMQRVWFLAHTLEAIGLEIERFGSQGNAVRILHGEMEITVADFIRDALGEEIRYYALRPAGLRKIETNIAFVTVHRDQPPVPPVSRSSSDP